LRRAFKYLLLADPEPGGAVLEHIHLGGERCINDTPGLRIGAAGAGKYGSHQSHGF
jgi:hypothetical protein